MAALTARKTRDYEQGYPALWNSIEVKDNVTIFAGSAVSVDSGDGRARALVITDAFFAGFSEQTIDSTTPASLAAGALEVRVRSKGAIKAVITGLSAITSIGASVYMTNDNDFTLTAGSNMLVGKLKRIVDASAGIGIVSFEANFERSL